MQVSAYLSVKGTKFYQASELFQQGSLSSGEEIHLEHEPDNPYDNNAVTVKIKSNGAMLGHLARSSAPKYAALINDDKIIDVRIFNIEKNAHYINIKIRIVYEQSNNEVSTKKQNSRLWLSASVIPAEAGVYAISNINSGRKYIGSSINIKNRIHSHIKDLSLGRHANHVLQSDFSRLGADYFEAKILVVAIPLSDLTMVEADQIRSLLNAGAALYNMTIDGQGIECTSHNINSEPISDRLTIQHMTEINRPVKKNPRDTEQQQTDKIYKAERKAVIDAFSSKLSELIPGPKLLLNTLAIFISTFILLTVVIQEINVGSRFIISTILAFVVSPFVMVHAQEKAKRSAQYQNLIRQRDEQLSAIDNKYKKKH